MACTRRGKRSDELPSIVCTEPSGQDGLDDADVLVPDDEVARARFGPRRQPGAAAALRPRVDRVDGAEALAVSPSGTPAGAGEPGGEVGAPGPGAGRCLRWRCGTERFAASCSTGRLLGLADLGLRERDHPAAGVLPAGAATGATVLAAPVAVPAAGVVVPVCERCAAAERSPAGAAVVDVAVPGRWSAPSRVRLQLGDAEKADSMLWRCM